MKEKIILAIKTKFPKANLSKARLNEISAKILTKVIDDETLIDSSIDEFNGFADIVAIAKQDDMLRTTSARLREIEDGIKPKKPEAKGDDPELPDDTPAYMKEVLKRLDSVSGELAVIKGEKNATTIRGKAENKLKDIPASYWSKRAFPDTEEALDAFVTEVTEDYTAFKTEMTTAGLNVLAGGGARSATGGTGASGAAEKIDPSVKAYMEKKTATATKEAAKQI